MQAPGEGRDEPNTEIVLRPPFRSDGGFAWTYLLPEAYHAHTDGNHGPKNSRLRLLENGIPLGPAHSLHVHIREQGEGRFSFKERWVWFSTSDGSDPNLNGRTYVVVFETSSSDSAVFEGAIPGKAKLEGETTAVGLEARTDDSDHIQPSLSAVRNAGALLGTVGEATSAQRALGDASDQPYRVIDRPPGTTPEADIPGSIKALRQRHKLAVANLVETLKWREIRRVVYFHADHFEPWKTLEDTGAVSARNADDVVRFVERMNRLYFARRLTLFYKAHLTATLEVNSPNVILSSPQDAIGFRRKSDFEREMTRRAMSCIAEHSAHEIQVHVHHEGFTTNGLKKSPQMEAALAKPGVKDLDDARFDLAVKMTLQAIQDETNINLGRGWLFVHGNWALNASDPGICKIEDEIRILMENGCIGDMTFPSPVALANPSFSQPFFCRPLKAAKGYDHRNAEVEAAAGRQDLLGRKFLIWSSVLNHEYSSLDYFAPAVRKRLEDPIAWLDHVFKDAYAYDGVLYYKTHAHSVHYLYWSLNKSPIYPLEHPQVQDLFGLLLEATQEAKVSFEPLTASEAVQQLLSASQLVAQ